MALDPNLLIYHTCAPAIEQLSSLRLEAYYGYADYSERGPIIRIGVMLMVEDRGRVRMRRKKS